MTTGPRSVLVVSLGGLGDFVTRWPLWQSVRRSFPGARVEYLGHPRHACLLLAAGLCDGALDFDAPRWARAESSTHTADIVVSAMGSRGRGWARRFISSHLFTVEPFPPAGARVSVGAHIDAEIRAAGLADPGPLRCGLPADAVAWAAAWRGSRGLPVAETIAIHPGSGSAAKNWPPDRFEELAAALTGSGSRVLLFEGDAEMERRARGGLDIPGVTRVSGLDLVQAAALLSGCRSYIGNDSGFSHLAALLGVPSTLIFGPTDPAVWAPRGKRVRVVTCRAACAPCGSERMRGCRDRRCLTGIGVADVLSVCA